jgi:rhodanese-related sulfurtransferase
MVPPRTRLEDSVTVEDARTLLAQGALLIDVRTIKEWDAGHSPHAVHTPLDGMPETIGILPRARRVLVLSRSGRRAADVVTHLRSAQIDAVVVRRGLRAWVAAGGELVATGSGNPRIG